jgi:gliding motility-associated-like protein
VIKPVFYCFFLALCVFSLKAQQNLVLNGSFEEYYSCPTGNNLNDGQFERCKYWWSPTSASPDFFHECNNSVNGLVGVPVNFWGYQEAYDGDGYVGFIPVMYDNQILCEYFRIKLNEYLKPCSRYRFQMYVNMANYSTHGIGKIGALFTQNDVFYQITGRINEKAQVTYSGLPIVDSVNWTKIEGSFIAKGGEQYLTIGLFEEVLDTSFVQIATAFYLHTYYYVDSVSLTEINEEVKKPCEFHLEIPNVFTPNNDDINDIIDLSQYVGFIDRIRIINRWGNTVKVLTKDNPIWDGSNCIDGVYYYIVEDDKFKTKQTGYIHLVR